MRMESAVLTWRSRFMAPLCSLTSPTAIARSSRAVSSSVGFARSAHPLDHHYSPRRRLVLDPRRRHPACLGRPDRRGSPADVRHARAVARHEL